MPLMAANFVAFQTGWFACVLGGAWGHPWLGVAVVALIVALHVVLAPIAGAELKLLLAAALVGTLWDSLLVSSGLLVYPSGQLAALMAPVWIIALWIAFATSLNVTMRWLKGRHALAAVLGGVCGPLTFWGGARLGAVQFTDPLLALGALAVGWSLLMPLLVVLGERFDGWTGATAGELRQPEERGDGELLDAH
ncbi:MAG TPA: DUF2878 domain-containing protein [Pseudomonadales bacterium]|nr:DUF2878 domain-containing protein [Pseudomonadales bacterium]